MRKIAITGNLASGKSTVARILQGYGACVVDADEIVHGLLSLNTPTGKKALKLLGPEIVVENQIDRKKIAEIVFSDFEKLKSLEKILNPAVKQEIDSQFNRAKNNPSYKMFVAEVPLLYEAGMEKDFDLVIAVIADESVARKRSITAQFHNQFDQRWARQHKDKASKADIVITNNGDLNMLNSSIVAILEQLI